MDSVRLTHFPNLYTTSEFPPNNTTHDPIGVLTGFKPTRDVIILAWATLLKQYTEHETIIFLVDGRTTTVDTTKWIVERQENKSAGDESGTAIRFAKISGSTEYSNPSFALTLWYDEESGDAQILASNRIPNNHVNELPHQLCSVLGSVLKYQGYRHCPAAATEPKLSILNPQPELLKGPQLLHQLLEQHRSDDKSAIEFLTKDDSIVKVSYKAFHLRANNLAAKLNDLLTTQQQSSGDQPSIPVLIDQSPNLYVALLGILKVGAAFCPLQLDAPEERIRFVLGDISAAIIVTTAALKDRIPKIEGLQICVIDDLDLEESTLDEFHGREPSPGDLAYIMYTSGSTGQPKGVGISHMAATQSLLAHDFLIPPFSRFLQFASPTFDVSQFEIFFTFFKGCTLLCCDKSQLLNDLSSIINKMDCDAAELTPTVAGSLLQTRDSVPGLKLLLTIGEMLNPRVVEEFGGSHARASQLYGMYGPTEATIHCTLEPEFNAKSKVGLIGVPFKTVSSYIVDTKENTPADSDLIVLPVGHIGELAIGGHQLATGYLNRKEQTEAAFINSPRYGRVYRTGDKARQLPDGSIECLGRIQSGQVKLRGQRIELGEIEHVALKTEACRLSVASIINGNLVLFCLADSGQLDKDKIFSLCQKWLPAFMVPSDIVVLQEMPRMPSGKIDKKTLESNYVANMNDEHDIEVGEDDGTEDLVMECVKKVLGTEIRRSTSLRRMGLDSLSSIRLASELRSNGYAIGAIDILNTDNVLQLCNVVRQKIDGDLEETLSFSAFETLREESLSEAPLKYHINDVEDVVPCTPLQIAMLAETSLDPKAYWNTVEIEFAEDIGPDSVENALRMVFAANSILRSGFVTLEDMEHAYAQVIWKTIAPEQILWTESSTEDFVGTEREACLRPMRVRLNQRGPQIRCVFHLHHSIYDGWSIDLILEDLTNIVRKNNVASRPQFREVVRYFAQIKDSESQHRSRSYWKHYLRGLKTVQFPSYGRQHASLEPLTSSQYSMSITSAKIKDAMGKTFHPQGLFQSAWAYLMTLYLGTNDVVFGSVNSGRTIPVTGIEGIIGPCIATLPLRIRPAIQKTVASLLLDVSAMSQKHAEHCTIPLHEMKRFCEMKPGQAMFDVLFIWQETINSHSIDGSTCRIVGSDDNSEFKIIIEVEPRVDKFAITIRHRESQISSTQITSICQQLEATMDIFLESPDILLDDVMTQFPESNLSIMHQPKTNGFTLNHNPSTSQLKTISPSSLLKNGFQHEFYQIQLDGSSTATILDKSDHSNIVPRLALGELAFRLDNLNTSQLKTSLHDIQLVEHPKLGKLCCTGRAARLLLDDTIEILGRVDEYFEGIGNHVSEDEAPDDLDNDDRSDDSERTVLERVVTVVVAQITGTPVFDINRRTSFFALGVDSVSAVSLAQTLRTKHALPVEVAQILKYPSAAGLVSQLLTKSVDAPPTSKQTHTFDESSLHFIKQSIERMVGCDNIETISPCTPLQEAMLAAETSSNNNAYFNHTVFEVLGNVNRLMSAIDGMFQRHEILRTCFFATNDPSFAFAQAVLRRYAPEWKHAEIDHGLQGYIAKATEEKLLAVDQERPPIRLTLLTAPKKEYIMLSMHHALYDGQAMEILLSEIETSYRGQNLGPSVAYSGFLDVALSQDNKTADEYWTRLLEGHVPISLEPLERISNTTDYDLSSSIGVCSRELPVSFERLEAVNKRASATMLSVLQAAWAKTLMTLLGAQDVCFGNVVSGRAVAVPGIEKLMAPCFNTLPVRVLASQAITNDELIEQLQTNNADSLEYPFTPLRRTQRLHGGHGRALFDTLFILQQPVKHLDGEIWQLKLDIGDMGFPLVCEAIPNPEKNCVSVTLHFRRSKLSDDVVDVVLEEFSASLDSCVEEPSGKVLSPPTTRAASLIERMHDSEFKSIPRANGFLPHALLKTSSERSGLDGQHKPRESLNNREQEVQNAFAQFSNVPASQITRNKTIYQLGLDSISAIQVARVLREQGFQVTAEHVLENPTVSMLGGIMERSTPEDSSQSNHEYFAEFDRKFRETICVETATPSETIESILPCTSMQAGMISQFLHSSGQNYFNNFVYELGPNVDAGKLREAWNATMHKHKMLRTGFVTIGQPDCPFAMVCYSSDTVKLPWHEDQSSEEPLSSLKATRSKWARKALNSLQSPPWHLSFAESNGRSLLQFSGLHALFDAESLQLILKDVHALLDAFPAPEFQSIEPLLRNVIAGAQDEEGFHKTFWQDYLRDLAATKFPNMLPLQPSSRNVRKETMLATSPLRDLEAGCQKQGISLQAAIQVAWATLLSAYTGETDVCFGLILSGRESDDAHRTVFPCSSTVPFRCIVEHDNSSLLEKTMEFNSTVRKHRHTPLIQIQRWTELERSALFDTLLVFQKTLGHFGDENLLTLIDEDGTVEYPVSLELIPDESGALRIQTVFWDDVLPVEQAKYMLKEFDAIVSGLLNLEVTQEENRPKSTSNIYSALQPKDPEIPANVSLLHQFVEEGALRHPDKVALEYYTEITSTAKPQQWTYMMLNEMGNKYAHALLQTISPGSIIVTCFDKCPEASFAFLGILKAGCVFLAVDQNAPMNRKAFIIEDSKASAVITTSDFVKDFEEQVKVPIIDAEQLRREYPTPTDLASPRIDPEDTSYCLYTSGSTGTPKGCILSHHNAIQFLSYFQRLFKGRWTETSRWLQFASFHFDVMVLEQFWPWSVGITCVSAPRDAIFEDLAGSLRTLNITHIDLTPSLARLITPEEVPSLCDGIFITGGEPLKQEVLDAWGHTGAIHNGYGPTECTIGCTMYAQVPKHGKASNIGCLYDNAGAYVLRPGTNDLVMRGALGELCISGVLVGKGYLGRPDLTAERFPYIHELGERIYRTGDLVRLLCDDTFEFCGRIDDQVKLRGQRLELGEIDAAITSSEALVDDVATLVVKVGQKQTDHLCSFVVVHSGTSGRSSKLLGEQDPEILKCIKDNCRDKLPPYMVPTQFLLINFLPLTTNNKVDSRALKALLDEYKATSPPEEADRSLVSGHVNGNQKPLDGSNKIAACLARLLHIQTDQLFESTNFFQVGLDSISVFSFTQELKREGFKHATTQMVMKSQTIHALSESLEQTEDNYDDMLTEAKHAVAAFAQRYRSTVADRLNITLDEIESVAPLTPLQSGIVARSLDGIQGLYFNKFVYKLAGSVNLRKLRSAWQAVFDQVSILRTCFVSSDDGYIQAVIRPMRVPWTEHLFKSTKEFEKQSPEWRRCWIEANENVMDRTFEIHIAKVQNHISMILHIFHGLYDATSLPIILEKVQSEYEGGGQPECGPRFHDILPYGPLKKTKGAREFWTEQLKLAQYNMLRRDPSVANNEAVIAHRNLDDLPSIEVLRRQLNVTHQAFVQVAWMATLQSYLQAPATTGLLVSGRSIDYEHVERTIGPMFNTLPFFLKFKEEDNWESVVRRCHDFNITALPYQHTPLREITKWAGRSSREPLFDTLLVFHKIESNNTPRYNSIWEEVDDIVDADYPLALEVEQSSNNQFNLTLVAQSDVLNNEECSSILDSFRDVLVAIITNPTQQIKEFMGENFEVSGSRRMHEKVENPQVKINGYHKFEGTDAERAVRDIVASVANVNHNEVVEDTSIFELGLDSVDAIKVSSRLKQRGFTLSVSRIMRDPLILQMAHNVQTSTDGNKKVDTEHEFNDVIDSLEASLKSTNNGDNDIEAIYPITPLQEGIVAEMHKSEMENYLNHDVLKIADDTEIEQLQWAWNTVIEHSPVLRTAFVEVDGIDDGLSYAQVVRRHHPQPFPFVTGMRADDFRHLFNAIQEDIAKSFTNQVPFRLTFVRSQGITYLIISMSHAMYDGWSLGLLHEDVKKAYRGEYEPRSPYRGVLKTIVAGTNSRAQSFWRNAMYEAQPSIFPRRNFQAEPRGSEVHFKEMTSAISSTQLKNFCRSESVTMQALGQTCWAFTLATYCRSLDVVFGAVLSGRDSEEAQKVMFPTMNTVLIRLMIHGSRKEMLDYVQSNLGEVMQHQHYPLRRVQRMARSSSDPKLFDTIFIYQHRPVGTDNENELYTSVGGASDLEYPVSVEMEIMGDTLVWRTSCKEEVLSEVETAELLSCLDGTLQCILETPRDPAAEFEGDQVSICGQPRFSLRDHSVAHHESSSSENEISPDSTISSQTDQKLREILSVLSKVPIFEIRGSDSIYNLGLDSISAIKIASLLKREGLRITVSQLLEANTVQRIGAAIDKGEVKKLNEFDTIDSKEVLSTAIRGLDEAEVLRNVSLKKEDVETIVPATAAQTLFLSLWNNTRGGMFYPTFEFQVNGMKESNILIDAWKKLVKEMPLLRTTFVATDHEHVPLCQVVLKEVEHNYSLSESSHTIKEKHCGSYIHLNTRGGSSPLRFQLKIHHALYDAVSLPLLKQRLEDICNDMLFSTTTPVTSGDFYDFLAITNTTEAKDERQSFWSYYLAATSTSSIYEPTSTGSRDSITRTGSYRPRAMKSTRHLDYVIKKHGISFQSLFFASIACIYAEQSRINEHEDIVFGVYLANRLEGYEALVEPTLNIVPLRVRSPLRRDTIQVAKEIQEDLHAISRKGRPFVSLWEVDRWTGIKIDCFLNFLRLPERENTLPNGNHEQETTQRKIAIEMIDPPETENSTQDKLEQEAVYETPLGLVGNRVSSSYIPCIDVEGAIREGVLAMGVFGPSTMLSEGSANEIIEFVCSKLQDMD